MNHHPKISHPTLRSWWNSNCRLSSCDLVLPLFVSEYGDCWEEIGSMPGVFRMGVNRLESYITPLVSLGLTSVLLFGVVETASLKDDRGSFADTDTSPVILATRIIREKFKSLLIICDLCICDYTSHGHCCIFSDKEEIDQNKTLNRLSTIALNYALAGAHVIAPSDMMDNRISAIKQKLSKYASSVSILSYSAKYASALYGPFRDACKSSPKFGDRQSYQLPRGSTELGLLCSERDIKEGADFIMVKPGMFYLDVIRQTKAKFKEYPLAAYQVSGEYAMIYDYAIKCGQFERVVSESLYSLKRAGADMIISYFTPKVLRWLADNNGILAP